GFAAVCDAAHRAHVDLVRRHAGIDQQLPHGKRALERKPAGFRGFVARRARESLQQQPPGFGLQFVGQIARQRLQGGGHIGRRLGRARREVDVDVANVTQAACRFGLRRRRSGGRLLLGFCGRAVIVLAAEREGNCLVARGRRRGFGLGRGRRLGFGLRLLGHFLGRGLWRGCRFRRGPERRHVILRTQCRRRRRRARFFRRRGLGGGRFLRRRRFGHLWWWLGLMPPGFLQDDWFLNGHRRL